MTVRNDVHAVIDFQDGTHAAIVAAATDIGKIAAKHRTDTIAKLDAVRDVAVKLLACMRRTQAGLYCVRPSKIDDYRHAIGELSELTGIAVPYQNRKEPGS